MDGTDGEDGSLGADGWLLTVLFEEGLEVGVLGFVCAVGFVSAGSVMVTRIVCLLLFPFLTLATNNKGKLTGSLTVRKILKRLLPFLLAL